MKNNERAMKTDQITVENRDHISSWGSVTKVPIKYVAIWQCMSYNGFECAGHENKQILVWDDYYTDGSYQGQCYE